MSQVESLSERDMANIIFSNADIMNDIAHPFDIDRPTIDMIFSKVINFANIEDARLSVIKKATVLFCEIAHCQPFLEGNRTTAFYAGQVFLRRHGYELPMTHQRDKDAISDLLTRTKAIIAVGITEERLCEEIERYLIEKVVAI